MKKLPLKTVMNGLRIVTLEDGYELHNAAGKAKYDVYGIREEVHGIPEYFPVSISIQGASQPTMEVINISSEEAFKLERRGWMIEKVGPAFSQGVASCGSDDIRQKTLSEVLAASLPQRSAGLAEQDAELLAKAVKAAFNVLEGNDASKS